MTGRERNIRKLAWVAVAAAGLGCVAPACGLSNENAAGRTMLTESENGTVRRAAIGETVEIRLAGQPGTGFSWIPSPGTNVTPVERSEPGEPSPGGVEMQIFHFRASRPGRYRLAFSYARPWAGGGRSGRSARFTIEVR